MEEGQICLVLGWFRGILLAPSAGWRTLYLIDSSITHLTLERQNWILTLERQNGICITVSLAVFRLCWKEKNKQPGSGCSWGQSPQRHRDVGGTELPPKGL